MATEDILREPPPPPPEQPMDLSAVQTKIQQAFRSGNLKEVARLNALAREISNRLATSMRTDSRFKRVQINPEAASEADRQYANSLIRNIGAARQMVESTQRAAEASDLESPGPSVGEEVAGVAAAGAAGEAASRAATGRLAKPLADATKAAAFDLKQGASIAEAAGKKARTASGRAGGAVGRAKQAVTRAEKAAAAPKPGTKGATTKALKGAQRVLTAEQAAAAAAKREAGRLTGEAATKRAAAKGFAATAARTAPRIFGAMPMGLAEVAISPIMAFYKTTEQAASFLGQLEKLSDLKGGPLGVDDLNTDTLDMLSTSPELLNTLLKSGVIDNSAYAFADPEGAAEMGLKVGAGGIQRGGDIFTVTGDDPRAAQMAQIEEELSRKQTDIPRIGADDSMPAIEADDPMPVARNKAVARAMEKRAAKAAPKASPPKRSSAPKKAMGEMPPPADMGEKPEGELPSFPDLERAPQPELLKRTPGLTLEEYAPKKGRRISKGLEKLLETFATMDVNVGDDVGI